MSKESTLTMQFVTGFQCTGDKCPDNCCHHWKIGVEEPIFEELEKLYGQSAEGKAFFDSALKIAEADSRSEQNYAILQNDEQGNCRFLDTQGWCKIHKEYGPEYLGHTCKDYPRVITENFEQTELTLSVSCPEAAKLLMLSDQPTELLETQTTLLQGCSGYLQLLPSGEELKPYYQFRNEIRQVLMLLAQATHLPVACRMFLMLNFAHNIAPSFHQHSNESTLEAAVGEIERIADSNNHPQLVQEFLDAPGDQALATGIILAIILFRVEVASSSFGKYVDSTLSHHGIDITSAKTEFNDETFGPLIIRYFENRTHIEGRYMDLLERALGNLLGYNCFKQHYVLCNNLLEHVRNIMLIIQMVKFMAMLHPKADEVCQRIASDNCSDKDEELLMDALIESTYQVARGFDHWTTSGMDILAQALDKQGIQGYEQLLHFARA